MCLSIFTDLYFYYTCNGYYLSRRSGGYIYFCKTARFLIQLSQGCPPDMRNRMSVLRYKPVIYYSL